MMENEWIYYVRWFVCVKTSCMKKQTIYLKKDEKYEPSIYFRLKYHGINDKKEWKKEKIDKT